MLFSILCRKANQLITQIGNHFAVRQLTTPPTLPLTHYCAHNDNALFQTVAPSSPSPRLLTHCLLRYPLTLQLPSSSFARTTLQSKNPHRLNTPKSIDPFHSQLLLNCFPTAASPLRASLLLLFALLLSTIVLLLLLAEVLLRLLSLVGFS